MQVARTLPYIDLMRFFSFPLLAVSLPALALVACTGAPEDEVTIAGNESNYTSEAGADGGEADASSDAAPAAAVEVAPFTLADVTSTPKLRFSYDGAPAADALQTEWTTVISGADRRFQLQGASPVPGGKPVFYMEFGKGPALIEKTTYDCAALQAVVLILDKDGKKNLTVVDGAAQRACKVVVDTLEERPRLRPSDKPTWNVLGHVEALVGPREDGTAPARSVRATFAAYVFDSSQ